MKNLTLDIDTIRGAKRQVSCGPSPRWKIYPDTYDEDFSEFPIEFLLVNDEKRGPTIYIIGGKCNVINKTGESN